MTRGRGRRLAGRRWAALVAVLATAGSAALPATGSASHGDTPLPLVVSLGDSFSAGEGAPPFRAGTDVRRNSCHRSFDAWPQLVAERHGAEHLPLACSGAETLDVLKGDADSREPERRIAQLARLRELVGVDLVTLTIGGNDAGFATVLGRCVASPRSCADTYRPGGPNDLVARIDSLRDDLRVVYRRVRRAAPGADLMVLGYPRLFPRDPQRPTCAPSSIGEQEIRFMNARTTQLNRIVKQEARARGATFVGVQNAFDGNELRCGDDPERMVNPLRLFGARFPYSFHPNALGYGRLAELAAPAWR
jgi:lysophospholipase L1-like esterase